MSCLADAFIRFDAFEDRRFRTKILSMLQHGGFDMNASFASEHPTEFIATKLFPTRNFDYFRFSQMNTMRNAYLWQVLGKMDSNLLKYENINSQNDAELADYLRKDIALSFASYLRAKAPLKLWDTNSFAEWYTDYDQFVLNCIFDRLSCAH